MIEILNIFYLFFIFNLIGFYNLSKNSLSIKITHSTLLFLNLALFFSLIKNSSQYFLSIYILLSISIGIILFKKKKVSLKNIKTIFFENKIYFFLLLFVFLILSIDIISKLKLGWDAQNFIFLKTLHFFNGKPFFNLVELDQPHYSHLGSYIWSIFWNNGFFNNEYNGRLFYLYFFLISLFAFCSHFKNKKIFIIAVLGFILLFYKYKYFFGSQEILNFSLFLILSSTIYRRVYLNEKVSFFEIIFLINLFMWFKNESIIMLFIIISYFVLFSKNLISFKEKLFITFSTLLLFSLRLIVYFYIESEIVRNTPLFDYQFEKTFSINFQILIDNFKIVTYYFAGHIFLNPFLLLNYLVMMYFIIFFKTHHIIFKPFIIFIIIFHTIFTYVAFMFNFYDVKFQTQVAMDRFLISTCGIYSLVYLIIYNKFKLKNDT